MSQSIKTQEETSREESNVTTPIKTVDASKTVKERFTDNAIHNILPARYLLKDNDGNVIEEPEELFERVAQNVAKAEDSEEAQAMWADEFQHLMETQQFMPNCVSPETMVGTPSGNKQITEVNEGDTISNDTGTDFVKETFDNGTKQMQTIRTEDGYTVTSSGEHVFRVLNEDGEYVWRMAKNVSPGTVMALKSDYITDTEYEDLDTNIQRGEKNSHTTNLPNTMSEDLATWLGFVIGDGSVRDSSIRVAFDSKDDSDEAFSRISESLFDIPANTRHLEEKNCTIVSLNSVELVRYIRQNEMTKPSSKSAYVPDVIESSGRDAITAFLSGLYDADGSVETRTISYYTSSRELAESVQQLLLGVGIVSKLSEKRDGYRVSIRKNKHGEKFAQQIGFVSTRKSNAVQRFIGVSDNSTTTKIPNQQSRLKQWYHNTDGVGHEMYEAASQFLIDNNSSYSQDISVEAYERLAKEYPEIRESPVAEFVENNLVFKKVESIVDAGRVRATDLNAPDRNTFIANGFVSHNSPTLMNAGTDIQQLSACFVLEPDDDMDSIFETAREAALIFKSGGGVGYTISHLRPRGAIVSSTGGESSGPLSFLEVYNTTCGTVQQGGKRRGAQMAILRVDHPDIGRFACAKREEGRFDNFNISAALTDDFIDAVKNDEEYTLYSPQSDYTKAFEVVEQTADFYNPEYENNPETWEDSQKDGMEGKLVKENLWRDYADTLRAYDFENNETIDFEDKWKDEIHIEEGDAMELPARFIFDLIIDGAWRNGEPGLFYFDETNRKHSFDVDENPEYAINATNPCAEQPLCEHEACNLGHINLSLVMEEDAVTFDKFDGTVEEYIEENVDMQQLERIARHGTRFLDNVVTMSEFPLEEINERVESMRKIGLGVMGFAQMLFQMGIEYGSEESYDVADYIMQFIDWASVQESHSLAKERGVFDAWGDSKYANPTAHPEWFRNHVYEDPEDWEDGYPIRNHNTTTVAPTGTTSMLGNTTGGIEPLYDVANFKNVADDVQGDDMLVQFDDYFKRTLEANGVDSERVKNEAVEKMRNNEFDGVDSLDIPEKIKDIFVTTGDLSSDQHAMIQRVCQKHVDSGISKTVNLPNDATREDVFDAFMLALKDNERGNPIKGLTTYRDGSREDQVLTTRQDNKLDETDEELHQTLEELHESGELSSVAAKEIGILDEDEEAICPECGEEMEDDGEACTICPECFYSPCS